MSLNEIDQIREAIGVCRVSQLAWLGSAGSTHRIPRSASILGRLILGLAGLSRNNALSFSSVEVLQPVVVCWLESNSNKLVRLTG